MLNSDTIILPSYLLPGKSYFKKINKADLAIINDTEIYRKQSPRNHFEILSSQGALKITFPVKKTHEDTVMKEVQIDKNQKWIKNHWKSIQTAYGKTPFFEYYRDLFENKIKKPPDYLLDLNQELLLVCLKILNIKTPVKMLSEVQNAELSKPLPEEEVRHEDIFGNEPDELAYRQHFGNDFVPSLSIIDLIFNHGPESVSYIV